MFGVGASCAATMQNDVARKATGILAAVARNLFVNSVIFLLPDLILDLVDVS